jgi:hypothetical protein
MQTNASADTEAALLKRLNAIPFDLEYLDKLPLLLPLEYLEKLPPLLGDETA